MAYVVADVGLNFAGKIHCCDTPVVVDYKGPAEEVLIPVIRLAEEGEQFLEL